MGQTTTSPQVITSRPTSVRWKIFVLLLMLVAINYIDRAALSVALPVISTEFGLTPTQQGMLLSAFFWTYALMQIPVGLLTDRMRPRIVIALATVGWGFFQAIGAACTSFIPLLFSRLGLGITESPIFPAGAKLNGIWMTPTERARGATLLDGGAPLGTAIGSLLIAGLISELGSWRMSFVISGAGTIIAGAIAYWYIRDTPREHPMINEAEVNHIVAANRELSGGADSHGHGRLPTNIGRYLRHPSVLLLFGGWMCYNSVFYGLLTWMPTYLFAVHGFDIKSMGGATFLIFFCGFVGELVGGYLTDKWRGAGGKPNPVFRTMFGISALMSMACLLGVAFISGPVPVVTLLAVALFFIRWCGMFWSIPGLLGAQAVAGTLAGAMNFCGNIVGITVPLMIGVIVSTTGSYFLALLFFAAAAAGLLICATRVDYERRIVTE